jgi:hypothetical protein
MILVVIIIYGFLVCRLIDLMIKGRGVLFPDFARIDKIFSKKYVYRRGRFSKWDSFFGRAIYYIMLLSLLIFIFLLLFMCFNC